jgi:hypothetical protein
MKISLKDKRRAKAWLFIVSVAAGACSRSTEPAALRPLEAAPVDAARISINDARNWSHRRIVETDLDGDSVNERVVLASDVQLNPVGLPIWEDGHRWAVFIEKNDQSTLLYGAFVPNGLAEVAVLSSDSEGRRHLLIQERTPQQTRSFVVSYERPGIAKTVSGAYYQVEQWLPSLHE